MNETHAAIPSPNPLMPSAEDPFAFASQAEIPVSMSHESLPVEDNPNQKRALYIGLSVLALAAFFGIYQYFVNDFNPYDALVDLFAGEPEIVSPTADPPPKAAITEVSPSEPLPDPEPIPLKGNPYWILPNANLTTLPDDKSLPEAWSIDQEAAIREGITHVFVYQHYKAVQDIRRFRWGGADTELRRAMLAKKFWTRMFAAIGLAEMAFTVPLGDLDRSLEGERSELISGFFERFVSQPNAGQAYIMRQVVRLVDARARLVILDGLFKRNDALSHLYLTAATQDINTRVRAKAQRLLTKVKSSPDQVSLTEQAIGGKIGSINYLKALGIDGGALKVPPSPSAKSTRSPEAKMLTDADIDQELSQFLSDPGEIEFYNYDDSVIFDAKDASVKKTQKK